LVVARTVEELVAWQLAKLVEREVYQLTTRLPASRHFKFCEQIQDSARSAVANTAEGFGRFKPRPFRQFLSYALSSLHETKDHLLEAFERRYISADDHERVRRLTLRAIKANLALSRYLKTCADPGEPTTRTSPGLPQKGAAAPRTSAVIGGGTPQDHEEPERTQ
jgi:four helix bundle protein